MPSRDDPVRVGVLALHVSKESKAICNAVEALGHSPEWLRAENTQTHIVDGRLDAEPSVDVIANRLLLSNTSQPCEELGLARIFSSIVPVLNPASAVLTAFHKYAAAAALAANGIPVPDAHFALDSATLNEERQNLGEMAVHKTAIGTHGGGTWKVGPEEEVSATVGNRRAFLQELISRDGEETRDLRVYVVGDQIFGAMYRYAPDHDWRTNVAIGGSVMDASDEITAEVEEIALAATDCLGLHYAGVDLVEGPDGWYVLEVNPTAGFKGLYRATGRSPAPYIAQLAIEHVGGTVDADRVRELASTLDDSVPSCRPLPRRGPTDQTVPTIGLTEEILVTGSTSTTQVIAKADTGADRTSIDTEIAAEIGAGPIKNITRVKSGTSKETRTRPVVDVVVGMGGEQHTVTASIEDRSHMDYAVILGRDILRHYHVDVTRSADETAEERQGIEE